MSRTRRVSGVALLGLALARPAQAQDVTAFVVALVPPILLAPPVLALGRWLWLRRRRGARFWSLLAVAVLEVVLWGALCASVLKLMTGDSGLDAPVLAVVAGGGLWMLSRIWFEPFQRAARVVFVASPPLVLLLLAAATWMVMLAVWQ